MNCVAYAVAELRYGCDMNRKKEMRVANFKLVKNHYPFQVWKTGEVYKVYDNRIYRIILSLYNKRPSFVSQDLKQVQKFLLKNTPKDNKC